MADLCDAKRELSENDRSKYLYQITIYFLTHGAPDIGEFSITSINIPLEYNPFFYSSGNGFTVGCREDAQCTQL